MTITTKQANTMDMIVIIMLIICVAFVLFTDTPESTMKPLSQEEIIAWQATLTPMNETEMSPLQAHFDRVKP